YSPSLARRFAYFLAFLGNFVVEWPKWTIPVGMAIAAVCAGLFSWLTWRALFREVRFGSESVIAALAGFAVLEAIAARVSRAHLGVDYALSLKYTICTLLLLATLFALVWRMAPQALTRVSVLLVVSGVLVVVNSPIFENGWRTRNRTMDAIAAEMKNGNI